eukprot:7293979-Pyramimonas_sp.AAC.1
MSARSWLVHLCGSATPAKLARTAASYFGATGAAAVALSTGHFPSGTSVRIGDLGGRGIMATSTM